MIGGKKIQNKKNGWVEEKLMNKIKMSWKEIYRPVEEIRKSIFSWNKRLRLVVEDGDHVEHKLK